MKSVSILVLLVVVSATSKQLSFGQNKNIENYLIISGSIEKAENDPMEGATVRLLENDSLKDSIITKANGKFTFQLELNHQFVMEVSKQDYVKKIFNINSAIPENVQGDWECAFLVLLFQPCPDLDLSLLKKPLFNLAYNNAKHEFDPVDANDNAIKGKLNQLLLDNSKCIDNEYRNIVRKADRLYHQKKYNEAMASYHEALDKRNDNYVKGQIAEIEKIPIEAKADSLYAKKDYADAVVIYKQALEKCPNDRELIGKISKIDKILGIQQKK
jgi:tetratricopeptide (TPR) repeat protein